MINKISNKYLYNNDLLYRCNTLSKGFIFLLNDTKKYFDENYNISYKKSNITKDFEMFGYEEVEKSQQLYFFKHLYLFFEINEDFNIYDKYSCILSSIAVYVKNPIDYIVAILNRNNGSDSIIKSLKSKRFQNLYSYQFEKNNNKTNIDYVLQINENSFSSDKKYLYNNLIQVLDKYNGENIFNVINIICELYLKEKQSKEELPNATTSTSNNIIETGKDSSLKQEAIDSFNSDVSNKSNENTKDSVLNKFFNPMESYISDAYDKYLYLSERMKYDSKDCRSIKTILYLITYLLKDKNLKTSEYMKNIINSDIGWAVGNENNKEPSFYGNSDIAKFIYGYYSYMTGKENPYTDLINNKIVKNMDYNAMLIHKYFKDNGVIDLGLDNSKLKDVYNLLVNFRDIVKIIDAPISLTGTYDNFISGIISSMMNGVSTMLDFSVSSIVKSLFYVEMIPINKKRYSISNLYNYINFIKLILENAGEYQDISYIDRDEFINQAYDVLGINENSLKRIGYFAYDRDFVEKEVDDNNNLSKVLYIFDNDNLFKNSDDVNFLLRKDLKLLYSLIQFGIQKKSVLTGDINFEGKFSFGDELAVKEILSYLTITEIYYIFSVYGINIWTLDDNLGSLTNKDILYFNKNLLFIDSVYDHHNTDFYNVYLNKSPNKIYKELEQYDFENTKYEQLITSMYNYYRKVLKYNKEQLDNIIFESNNISDIDDFFIRFIPSITELLKLFGQNTNSIKQIANFLDSILVFITEVLFRNLFIKIKNAINDMVTQYTDELFEKLKELKISDDSEEFSYTIDLDFGNSKFMQSVDLIIDLIEKGNFNFLSIQSCFNEISSTEDIYEPMEYDDLVYNHGHNSISRNDFFDDTNNSLDQSYIGTIEKEDFNFATNDNTVNNSIEDTKENIIVNNNDFVINNNLYDKIISTNSNYNSKDNISVKDNININNIINNNSNEYINYKDNKKIFYNKGNILIEKNNGTIITVVSKNDKNSLDYSYIEYPEIIDKELSQDEYEQLVEIRDYIDNITNKELISLNKQLNKERNNLKQEMSKTKPNYSVIQNINKLMQKLTSAINDVKKENRILTTESSKDETVVIQNFEQNTSNSSENIYSTLDNFFKSKKEILKEVNNIVINNDVILTNYQITELLK